VAEHAFVAPNATLVGDVAVGTQSAIWYGAVLRGDVNHVRVGAHSSIGEDVVVHVSSGSLAPGAVARSTSVGDNVLVEAGALLHACTVQNHVWIQTGAIVMDGVVVNEGAIVGPSSLVTKSVPPGEYWAGVPALKVRDVTQADRDALVARRSAVLKLAGAHDEEHSKSTQQLHTESEATRNNHFGEGLDHKH
jgi:carbonic anhydrase/acetyltransferase-like protein (isoleucine patch superfamily)